MIFLYRIAVLSRPLDFLCILINYFTRKIERDQTLRRPIFLGKKYLHKVFLKTIPEHYRALDWLIAFVALQFSSIGPFVASRKEVQFDQMGRLNLRYERHRCYNSTPVFFTDHFYAVLFSKCFLRLVIWSAFFYGR